MSASPVKSAATRTSNSFAKALDIPDSRWWAGALRRLFFVSRLGGEGRE